MNSQTEIHTYTDTQIEIDTCAYKEFCSWFRRSFHIHASVSAYAYVCMYLCVCMFSASRLHLRTYVHVCARLHICMSICIYDNMCKERTFFGRPQHRRLKPPRVGNSKLKRSLKRANPRVEKDRFSMWHFAVSRDSYPDSCNPSLSLSMSSCFAIRV